MGPLTELKAWVSADNSPEEGADRNRKMVATGKIDGKKVYAVSSNRTSARVRRIAARLGYQRVTAKLAKGKRHAEHIILAEAKKRGGKKGYCCSI